MLGHTHTLSQEITARAMRLGPAFVRVNRFASPVHASYHSVSELWRIPYSTPDSNYYRWQQHLRNLHWRIKVFLILYQLSYCIVQAPRWLTLYLLGHDFHIFLHFFNTFALFTPTQSWSFDLHSHLLLIISSVMLAPIYTMFSLCFFITTDMFFSLRIRKKWMHFCALFLHLLSQLTFQSH